MLTDAKSFIALMRRATHCRFDTVIMMNRLLGQCYNLDIDSDVGLNYILFIPETEEYESDFYDETLVLKPSAIIDAYNEGHRSIEAMRKDIKAKPKDVKEEVYLKTTNEGAELKFCFYLSDELITTSSYKLQYPVDMTMVNIENFTRSYNQLLNRIKLGGACLVFDGLRYNLQEKAVNSPEIYNFIVRYRDKKIKVPLMRSMFGGIKEVDSFYLSVQESTLKDIVVYSLQYTKKGITEQYWGYILLY